MAQVTVLNKYSTPIELPAPLFGSLGVNESKVFHDIAVHELEHAHELAAARDRGILDFTVAEDGEMPDDMEESTYADTQAGLVVAHAALATGVHGVGVSTVA